MLSQGLNNIVGQRVDETYFVYNSVENMNSPSLLHDTMEQAVAKVLYPNGQPMFRLVRKPIECIPCSQPQHKPRLTYQPLPITTWSRFNELEIKNMNDALQDFDPMPYERRMARKIYNNKGGLLTGAAGTGKTFLSDMIVEIIAEKEPGALIIRAALTHVAALLQKGQTIAHILHKYLRETDAWFIFDEISMIPSQLRGTLCDGKSWEQDYSHWRVQRPVPAGVRPMGRLCRHRNFKSSTYSVQRTTHQPHCISQRHRPSTVCVLPRQTLPYGF